jgi:hypothetical protein
VPQTRVFGGKMDAWGREKYGVKPTKVDALTFRRERVQHMYEEILKEQDACRAAIYPSSFVTFKTRTSQVGVGRFLKHKFDNG